MSLIDVIFKKNALPKVPASLKDLVGEIKGIKAAIADLWRSMTNAEGNINRLDEAVEADENTLGDITMHKVYLTGSALNQSMMSKENTIYVVKDDLTLSEDVTIPANCVLEFEGGSINGNKTLTGSNTGIEAGLVKIFSTDVTLDGSWNVNEFRVEWILPAGDCSFVLNRIISVISEGCLLSCSKNLVVAEEVIFNKNIDVEFASNVSLTGNGCFTFNGICYSNISFRSITGDGSDGNTVGIKMINGKFNHISFNSIRQCKYGISFNEYSSTTQSLGQNIFNYLLIERCGIGIYFKGNTPWNPDSVIWAEGNEFLGGFIAGCTNYGILLEDGIKCGDTIFLGAVDCIEGGDQAIDIADRTNSTDYAQKNLYISNFLRPNKCEFRTRDTIVATAYGIQTHDVIKSNNSIIAGNGDNSTVVAPGSLEIANSNAGGGFIDLKSSSSSDRDIRIISDDNILKVNSTQTNTILSVGDNASVNSEQNQGKIYLKENEITGSDVGTTITPNSNAGQRGMRVSNNVIRFPNAGTTSVDSGATKVTVNFTFKPADTTFLLFITPSWKTLFNVRNKSVDGFVVEFDTAAPSDASIQWMMVGTGLV